MSNNRYANGMYKTTNKAQDQTAQNLFKVLNWTQKVYMRTDFMQSTGDVYYYYDCALTGKQILVIHVNEKGLII